MIVTARTEEVAIQQVSERKWRIGFVQEGKHKNIIGHKKVDRFVRWIVEDQGFILLRDEDDSTYQLYGREVEVELPEPDWVWDV